MTVKLNNDIEIKTGFFDEEKKLPLVITTKHQGSPLRDIFKSMENEIEANLLKYGGILFRGFRVDGTEDFENIVKNSYGDPIDYNDRATHRTQVQGKVYTATNYPPELEIVLHNESSFAAKFPMRIFFYCIESAEKGGETPIADVRKVYRAIPPSVRKPFEEKGVLYARNLAGGPFGFTWQEVYQTQDKTEMEKFCRESETEYEWIDENKVRTKQLRPAIARHPVTGEMLWLNHATVLNVFAIEPKLQQMLLKFFKERDLPNNTYYGDGTSIGREVIDELRKAYDSATVAFKWEPGDVLMLDNMLVAHGRKPFSGKRKIVVAMAKPVRWKDLDTSV
ncbi:MAG: TauD/TfdA family dioxygenase [Thermodesulfobacteriota bacterium]